MDTDPFDIDATILIAHFDKENATPTYKRTFGHAPLLTYLDHGEGGTGESLAVLLRPRQPTPTTPPTTSPCRREALTQLPEADRDRVLVRTDAAGGTHAFLAAVTELGLEYSVVFAVTAPVAAAVRDLPEWAWTPAYDGEGIQREAADVAELRRRAKADTSDRRAAVSGERSTSSGGRRARPVPRGCSRESKP